MTSCGKKIGLAIESHPDHQRRWRLRDFILVVRINCISILRRFFNVTIYLAYVSDLKQYSVMTVKVKARVEFGHMCILANACCSFQNIGAGIGCSS